MNGNVTYNGSQLLSGAINVNTTGNIQALNVQVTENGERTITPPEGVDGYAPITIDTNVPIPEPVLDSISITQNGTYTPPSGVDGYDVVNVNVPQPTPVLDDITITANGTYTPPSGVDGYDEITVNVSQDADIQPLTRTITTNGTTVINASDLNVDGFNPVTITTAVDGYTIKTLANTPLPIASFSDGTDNPLKSLTASIVPVQAGSGDPSPENVRPISGWAEEVITRCGKNLLDTSIKRTELPFIVFGGTIATNTPDGSLILNSGTYTISVNKTIYTIEVRDNPSSVIKTVSNTDECTFTLAERKAIKIALNIGSQTESEMTYQIEVGETATTYEPYAGTTTTIPFTDSQGNPVEVYGGSVDVVNGGEQPRTLGKITFDGSSDENWVVQSTAGFFIDVSDKKAGMGNYIANNYKATNSSGWDERTPINNFSGHPTLSRLYFRYPYEGFSADLTAWREWLASNNVQVVYELATPTTFYTQPTSIKSLDGENNVFASTGDVEELKYFADL